jgi:hypothetical protein
MVTTNIYALELEQGKYYIGKTQHPDFRLNDHFSGNGSTWTKMYKPIKTLEIVNNCSPYDEDKYVFIYANKYGIENVRGGSFSKPVLTQNERNMLSKVIVGANDKCFGCGGNHFIKYCPNKIVKNTVVNSDTTNSSARVVSYYKNGIKYFKTIKADSKPKVINAINTYTEVKHPEIEVNLEPKTENTFTKIKHPEAVDVVEETVGDEDANLIKKKDEDVIGAIISFFIKCCS